MVLRVFDEMLWLSDPPVLEIQRAGASEQARVSCLAGGPERAQGDCEHVVQFHPVRCGELGFNDQQLRADVLRRRRALLLFD